jgi:hypothetical protein
MAHIEPNSAKKTKDNLIDFELWKEGQCAERESHPTRFSVLRQRQHSPLTQQLEHKTVKEDQGITQKLSKVCNGQGFQSQNGKESATPPA